MYFSIVASVLASIAVLITSTVNVLTFSVFRRRPIDIGNATSISCSTDPLDFEHRLKRIHLSTQNEVPVDTLHITQSQGDFTRTCILYSHGNAEHTYNRRYIEYMCRLSDSMHCDIVTYDYVGYGVSSKRYISTEARCMQSIHAAYAYVSSLYPTILLMGWSLGTAPTLRLSLELLSNPAPTRITGVVLLSPLLSAIRTRFDSLGKALRVFDVFDNDSLLKKHPAMQHRHIGYIIIHGTDDRVIPSEHSISLHAQLSNILTDVKCKLLKQTGHRIPMSEILIHARPMIA